MSVHMSRIVEELSNNSYSWAMYGLVPSIQYMRLLIALWYGMLTIVTFFSIELEPWFFESLAPMSRGVVASLHASIPNLVKSHAI